MKIKNFFFGLYSQLRSMIMIMLNIFSSRETRLYPDNKLKLSLRYRGRIILTRNLNGDERCVACGLCSVVCPSDCISIKKSEKNNGRWYAKTFKINLSRCIFCGLCEEACPTSAIQLIPDVELSDFSRKNLIYEKKDLLISGPGKFREYDFYNISGVELNKKKYKYSSKKTLNTIDITSLLP